VSDSGWQVKLTLDTLARDQLTIAALLDRQDQHRLSPSKAFLKQTSGNFTKDTILGSIGEIGGKLGSDRYAPGGEWTVLEIPVGDYGLVQRIRTRLRNYVEDAETPEGSSPNAGDEGVEYAVMCFGEKVTAGWLNARRPDPTALGDFADVKAADDDFQDRSILGAWGGEDRDENIELAGHGRFGKPGTDDPTGNFFDDAGFPFRAPDCVLYLAVYPTDDATILAGRHIWWQLDEGT
jgi:hypothetical protein